MRQVVVIALNTFRENLRDKILYNLIFNEDIQVIILKSSHCNCYKYHRFDFCEQVTHSVLLFSEFIQVNVYCEFLDRRYKKSLI